MNQGLTGTAGRRPQSGEDPSGTADGDHLLHGDPSEQGKVRVILLPGKLCRKLKKYAKKQKIASGEIFPARDGASLSRKQIWREMKQLCEAAGVTSSKVFPHNLRHLFAVIFYQVRRDIAKLADVLGHSSIETTRIYLRSTGSEHTKYLEQVHPQHFLDPHWRTASFPWG